MTSGPPTPPPGTPRKPDETPDQPPSEPPSEAPPSGPLSPPPVPPSRPLVPPPPMGVPGVPQAKRKRDPLPFIIIGVVVVVLAAICCLGGALVLFDRRTAPEPTRSPLPPMPTTGRPSPSIGPSGSAGGGAPLSRADGVWRQTYVIGRGRFTG